jgi:hypothetical protein
MGVTEVVVRSKKSRILATCALAGTLLAAPALYAQQSRDGAIARLVEMSGNVLVSREAGLASGNESLRLQAGTRVITTAQSGVVVEYDNGCRVRLKENQRFEVEKDKPCAALLAQDIIAGQPDRVAGFILPAAVVTAIAVPAGAAAVGVALTVDARGGGGGGTPVSPN